MKRLFCACVAVISGLAAPLAAHYNYNCCQEQCSPCCSEFNGFYVGGNIGIFSHTAHRNDLDGFFTDNSGWSSINTSFEAGVQLGYDWQCCNTVAGIVVDWNWVDTHHKIDDDPNGSTIGSRFQRARNHWFTTIRGRVGVTVCDALVYITGGAVVTHQHNRYVRTIANEGEGLGRFNDHRTRWGWVGGVGTEFMLGCNWSLGAELLFLQFNNHNRTFNGTIDSTPARFAFGASDSAIAGRILLNYRFGDLFGGCCW